MDIRKKKEKSSKKNRKLMKKKKINDSELKSLSGGTTAPWSELSSAEQNGMSQEAWDYAQKDRLEEGIGYGED
jgi:hypothetical protein